MRKRSERQYKLRGEVIADAMEKRGLSQAALADALRVDVTTIRRWLKSGKAYMRNIIALAKALGIPHQNLMEGFEPLPADDKYIEVSVKIPILEAISDYPGIMDRFAQALEGLLKPNDPIHAERIESSGDIIVLKMSVEDSLRFFRGIQVIKTRASSSMDDMIKEDKETARFQQLETPLRVRILGAITDIEEICIPAEGAVWRIDEAR